MPSTKKPPRHTEEVVAIILYYGILGVDVKVVAKLVELKNGTVASPKECRERLEFASLILFPQKIPWTPAGVGKYIAGFTNRDTFKTITAIDGECKKILGKQPSVTLAVLNDKKNEAKVAFEERLDEIAGVTVSKAAGCLNDVEPSGLNHGETTQTKMS